MLEKEIINAIDRTFYIRRKILIGHRGSNFLANMKVLTRYGRSNVRYVDESSNMS